MKRGTLLFTLEVLSVLSVLLVISTLALLIASIPEAIIDFILRRIGLR